MLFFYIINLRFAENKAELFLYVNIVENAK